MEDNYYNEEYRRKNLIRIALEFLDRFRKIQKHLVNVSRETLEGV